MKRLLILLLVLSAIALPGYARDIKSAEELISAMQKKYAGKWYKTLTFVQKNTEYKADGTTQNSIWYEALTAPGNLRIDFDPLNKGDGLMFSNGMQHSFKEGKLAGSRPFIHQLLVLGFDVYMQPAEKTVTQLKDLKFDLTAFHEDTWQGKPVYVVGAQAGDTKSMQFWIDKKDLLFVRLLQMGGKNKDIVQETQFNKYQKVKGGGWVSEEVLFMANGKPNWKEEYTDVQTNVLLDKDLYDTGKWMTVNRNYYQKR